MALILRRLFNHASETNYHIDKYVKENNQATVFALILTITQSQIDKCLTISEIFELMHHCHLIRLVSGFK